MAAMSHRGGVGVPGPGGEAGKSASGGSFRARQGREASRAATAWVLLAAGMGTRMKSSLPKVLHPLCGRPLGSFALETARRWQPAQVVVVTGHEAEQVEAELGRWARRMGMAVTFARQQPQLGTGHAVLQALPHLAPSVDEVVVSYADTPLVSEGTLQRLCERRRVAGAELAMLTAVLDDPHGYGRVIRAPGEPERVTGVVEERDATPEQRAIREINAGVYAFARPALERALAALRPDNAQHEYYLTDAVGLLATSPAGGVVAVPVEDPQEILGVNDRSQLHQMEALLRGAARGRLMASGVTFAGDPPCVVDPWVEVGRDSVLHAGAWLLGETRLGERCWIGPGAVLIDCQLEDDVVVEGTMLVECRVGKGARVGAGAWIAPRGTRIRAGARVGAVAFPDAGGYPRGGGGA